MWLNGIDESYFSFLLEMSVF